MSRIFKIVGGILGIVALFMMFLPQVSVHWVSDPVETIGLKALVGGEFVNGNDIFGAGSGLAGYILAGVGGLLLLVVSFVPFFKEHDVLKYIVTGIAVVCLIIAIIMIFLIRKSFDDLNAISAVKDGAVVFVGAGAMVGGSLAALSCGTGLLGFILDFAE